jgi:hypothetical protein
LIDLTLTLLAETGEQVDHQIQRYGIREFKIEKDQFVLNGTPVMLLGTSLVRYRVSPHWWRREYLETYFRFLKQLGFNSIRIHGFIGPSVIFEVADEIGLLVQSQSSIWSSLHQAYRRGGSEFIENAKQEFKEWYLRDRNHPSVVLWDIENEMLRCNPQNMEWVDELISYFKKLDPSRPVVTSGEGFYEAGDIYHFHNNYRFAPIIDAWKQERRKPLVFGEWWGPEFAPGNVLRNPDRHLADPESQRDLFSDLGRYYATTIAQHRRGDAAGTMPFYLDFYLLQPLFQEGDEISIPKNLRQSGPVFRFPELHPTDGMPAPRSLLVNPNWSKTREQILPNPETVSQLKTVLAPLFFSLEESPSSAYLGEEKTCTLFAHNNTSEKKQLNLRIGISQKNFSESLASLPIELAPGERKRIPFTVRFAAKNSPGIYTLSVLDPDNLKTDVQSKRIALHRPLNLSKASQNLPIYISGQAGKIESFFQRENIPCSPIGLSETPPEKAIWILPHPDQATPDAGEVARFLATGGRMLILRHEHPLSFLETPLRFSSAIRLNRHENRFFGIPPSGRDSIFTTKAPILAPLDPLFEIFSDTLGPWSSGDRRVADDTYLLPTPEPGNHAGTFSLLAGGAGRSQVSLFELRRGSGLALISQLTLLENLDQEAEAEVLFAALLLRLNDYEPKEAGGVSVTPPELQSRLEQTYGVNENNPTLICHPLASSVLIEMLSSRDPHLQIGKPLQTALQAGSTILFYPADSEKLLPVKSPLLTQVHRHRSPLLAGYSSYYLDNCETITSALPLATKNDWQDLITVSAENRLSLWGGRSVGDPFGSLCSEYPFGKGRILLTSLNLEDTGNPAINIFWNFILSAAHAAITTPAGAIPSNRVGALKTPPLPLDGDIHKWTNTETDIVISNWKRANPLFATPATSRLEGPEEKTPGPRAFIAYPLWDDENFYLALAILAPEHFFAQGTVTYQKTAVELFLNQHQLLFSKFPDGKLDLYSTSAELKNIRIRFTESPEILNHQDVLELGSEFHSPKTAPLFVEIAVPWKNIFTDHPVRAGEELAFAVGVDFGSAALGKRALQLILPQTFEFNSISTCYRLTLNG